MNRYFVDWLGDDLCLIDRETMSIVDEVQSPSEDDETLCQNLRSQRDHLNAIALQSTYAPQFGQQRAAWRARLAA